MHDCAQVFLSALISSKRETRAKYMCTSVSFDTFFLHEKCVHVNVYMYFFRHFFFYTRAKYMCTSVSFDTFFYTKNMYM